MTRVLILGGTGEARELAAVLAARPGWEVISALAGRVADPVMPAGAVRVGGFGGVAGLTDWLQANDIEVVVDATHPFAARITEHAVAAAGRLHIPLLLLRRPGWVEGPEDRWHRVPDATAAAALLSALGERIFLATGRGDLPVFARLDRLWFLLRAVDPPPPPLPARCAVLLARGPFPLDGERELLRRHRIDVVVSRDSGGAGSAAKLVAARELGLPVVLLDRPAPPDVPLVGSVEEALTRL